MYFENLPVWRWALLECSLLLPKPSDRGCAHQKSAEFPKTGSSEQVDRLAIPRARSSRRQQSREAIHIHSAMYVAVFWGISCGSVLASLTHQVLLFSYNGNKLFAKFFEKSKIQLRSLKINPNRMKILGLNRASIWTLLVLLLLLSFAQFPVKAQIIIGDFTIRASANPACCLPPGQSALGIIIISNVLGFYGVSFTVNTGLVASIDPTSLTMDCAIAPCTFTADLTVKAPIGIRPSSYEVDVVASGGPLSHQVPITVDVQDFQMSINPSNLVVSQTQSVPVSTTVTVTSWAASVGMSTFLLPAPTPTSPSPTLTRAIRQESKRRPDRENDSEYE